MVVRTVTTVWCTELGTTLLIGFESTTVIPAYFRCLSPSSVHQSAASNQVPFPVVPAARSRSAFEVLSYAETVEESQHIIGDHTRVQFRIFRLDVFYQQS